MHHVSREQDGGLRGCAYPLGEALLVAQGKVGRLRLSPGLVRGKVLPLRGQHGLLSAGTHLGLCVRGSHGGGGFSGVAVDAEGVVELFADLGPRLSSKADGGAAGAH